MTDFTREIDDRYPTPEEVEQMMARARRLRAKAWKDAFASIARKLQEAVSPKRPARHGVRGTEPRHA